MARIAQVTPTIYSRESVIGGGEKGVLYVDHALRRAAEAKGLPLETSVVSFGVDPVRAMSDHQVTYHIVSGTPWDAASIDARELTGALRGCDAVYIDQCLHPVGMFAAAHARLLGLRVIGKDSGAGEYPLLRTDPALARVFHGFHAQSEFARTCFSGLPVPVSLIPGPIDSETYMPAGSSANATARDPRMILAVGRVMPHKGLDRIIGALPPDLSLVVAGNPVDTDYLAWLHEQARGKNVTFRAGLDDAEIRGLLRHAGLFVQASTHFDCRGTFAYKPELLGLAPLEALSCGLPVLVSSAGALPELARLPGCLSFRDDNALAALLRSHAAGSLPHPSETEMHAAVAARYGPLAFGPPLLALLLGSF